MSATSTVLRVETLFDCLRRVERRVDSLLSASTYDDESVSRLADEAASALAELGDAFVAVAPFPTRFGGRDEGHDEALTRVLESRYADPESTVGIADKADLRSLVEAGRLDRRGESVTVPLGRDGPAARNWGPALAVMRTVTDDLLDRARTLLRRSRAVDTPAARVACESLWRMVGSLRDVLVRASSSAAFVGRRTDRRDGRPLSFAEWAGDRLNGGDNA